MASDRQLLFLLFFFRVSERRCWGASMKLPRRRFLHLAAGAMPLATVSRIATAQTYPSRPVRWIVGFAPGGGYDVAARVMGQWLSERLGQQFVIENRPGASTNVATEVVVLAPADGYTLLLVGLASAINATLYEKLNFNFIRDIAPIAGIIGGPLVMVVNPSVSAKTVPEFIAYAKANPGKVNMGSAGIGSGSHLAGELLKMRAGIDMVHVPFAEPHLHLQACSAHKWKSYSPLLPRRSRSSGPVSCAHWRSPRRRARPRCRTSRP